MLVLSVILALVSSSVLIYVGRHVNDGSNYRLRDSAKPVSADKLEINQASSTSMYPTNNSTSSQSGKSSSPQPSASPQLVAPTVAPDFPANPVPCKSYIMSTYGCGGIFCPDVGGGFGGSCGGCHGSGGPELYACIAE